MTTRETAVSLRLARPDDAERIARFHTASWRRTYRGMMTDAFLDDGALDDRRRVWHQRLTTAATNQHVCIAEDGPTIVGFICVLAGQDPVWGSCVDNLHVASERHRLGIGRRLMREAAEWLCRVQAERGVWLWVFEANAPARAFYERLGAANAGVTDLEDPGGGHARNCRYVWARPILVLQACARPEYPVP